MTLTIDAHQHYWQAQRFDYGWTRQGIPALDRDYLPTELEPQLDATGVSGTVVVQVLHTEDETRWMLDLARRHPSIVGVVGWVDLTAEPDQIRESLRALRTDPRMVGIRHLIHEEPDLDWTVRPDVLRGMAVLEELDVAYELLLRPPHLKHVPTLSARLPRLRMVIDHIAKPYIARHEIEPWATEMAAAAENPNMWCKVSGMVTEADLAMWTPDDLAPYVETVMRLFGPQRLMFGSDWPVCTLAASYERVIGALRAVLGGVDAETEGRVFGRTAIDYYGLQVADGAMGSNPTEMGSSS